MQEGGGSVEMKKIFFSKTHVLLIVFLLLKKNHFRRPKYSSSDRFDHL